MDNTILEIPIKIYDYDILFNELDYRELNNRELNPEVDGLIDKTILNYPKKFKAIDLKLIVNMPIDKKDINKEELSIKGIINHYEKYFTYKRKINLRGIRRIIYYLITAAMLFTLWSISNKYLGEHFLSAILNAGGTVLIWEIMSMVFIERKNMEEKGRLKRKILNMDIEFNYINI